MQLQPCPACNRHVVTATACPFCASTDATVTPRDATPLGRMSRAMVFATLAMAPACGGKAKSQPYNGDRCMDPDPAEVERLEKQKAETPTDADKAKLDMDIAKAKQPVCMPYGAPPRRQRVV